VKVIPYITTFAVALLGVGAFMTLDLPLPWLLGPILACLLAALIGVPMKGIKPVNEAMRSILGVAVGATFTVPLLISMGAMWPTLLMIPLMVLAIGALGVPYFHRFWGYDFPTSYYATMPGGLQDMLVFGEEAGGNVRTLSLIHATRVLVIVVALPFILQAVWNADLSNPPGEPAATLPPSELAIMVICALVGWRFAKAIGMFGASILGGSRVLRDPDLAYARFCRGHPSCKFSTSFGDDPCFRTGRTGRIDRSGSHCRGGHGLRDRASCAPDIYRDLGCADFCAPV